MVKLRNFFKKILGYVLIPFEWTYDKCRSVFFQLKYGIGNIFAWLPTIWRDRDWDYNYLFYMLHKKLSNMEKSMKNHSHFVGSEKVVDDLKLCRILLDRLICDEYHDNAFIHHNRKWGNLEMISKPIPGRNCLCSLDIFRTKLDQSIANDVKLERHKSALLYKHSDNMKNQDSDMLFKTIRKHVFTWWD